MTGRRGQVSGPGGHGRRGAVLVAVLGILTAACTTAVPTQHDAALGHAKAHVAPNLVPAPGGTVTVALDQVPSTLNDHTVAGDTPAGRMVASLVWAQVFRVGPDLIPQLDTNVVDSAEVISLQPQTVVYQIDPRAVWSDGVAITAGDFAYAWDSQKGGGTDLDGSPDSAATTLGYRDIASLTGTNRGRTVTVVFRTPFADWAALFDDLLPAHIAQRVGWNHGFDHFDPGILVSGGPWRVVAWKPGSSIVFGHNPKWWASAPFLDRIEARAVPTGALPAALAQGQVQMAYPGGFDQSFMAAVSSSPVLQSRSSLGTRMLQLEFNVKRPPLDVATVRQGIAHAIDRGGLVSSIGQPENHSVWEDNDHLFANNRPGYGDNATGYELVDPATSMQLLEQSGLAPDAHGTWSSHGKPVSLTIAWADDDPWSAAAGPIVAAQLVAAGFDVASTPVPAAQLYGTVLPSGAFDLALVPVDSSAYPSTLGKLFSTQPAIAGGAPSQDWSGFDDPKIDTLFTQAVQELAPPSAQMIYGQIDQALWTAMPTLPLFAEPTVMVWSLQLSGVSDDPGGLGPLWSERLWALLKAAPAKGPASPGTTLGSSRSAR